MNDLLFPNVLGGKLRNTNHEGCVMQANVILKSQDCSLGRFRIRKKVYGYYCPSLEIVKSAQYFGLAYRAAVEQAASYRKIMIRAEYKRSGL